jgi:hypothetical protein
MKKYALLVLSALPAFMPAALAQTPAQLPPLAQRSNLPPIPSYEVHRAKTPPRIDGTLDDAAWADAKPVTFVFPWENQTGKKQKTTARLTWDNDNLYVAYECEDSDITATRTQRDEPTYMDDAVELFIGPTNVKNLYLGFEMNVRGALYDYLYPFPQRFIKNYNVQGIQIATAMRGTLNNSADQDQGWSLEVAIPWRAFSDLIDNPVPKIGDRWIANMNRWDGTRPDRRLSQWSDSGLVRADPHYPDRFGQLLFAE